jgi:hypothetical protein
MNNMKCKECHVIYKKKIAIVEEISGIEEQILKTVCFISHRSDRLIKTFFSTRPIHYLCSIP